MKTRVALGTLALVAPLLILAAGPSGALTPNVTVWVASSGSNSSNCQNPTAPCATTQYALTQAAGADPEPGAPMEIDIMVGPGTFALVSAPCEGCDLKIDGSHATTLTGTAGANRSTLTLEDVTINGGGGNPLQSGYASEINVVDSTITNSNVALAGGGIGGNVTLTDSTLTGNVTGVKQGTYGSATITDSTLTANNVGVEVDTAGNATIAQSTIAGNDVGIEGTAENSNLWIAGTLVGDDSSSDCDLTGATVTDLGYNLDGDGSCGFNETTSLSDANPDLGPLTDNGGPTQTMEPQSGSPAINQIPLGTTVADSELLSGDISLCPGPTGGDQRSISRPQGPECDIGAVEVQVLSQVRLVLTSVSGVIGESLTLTTGGGSGGGAVSYSAVNGTASGCSISVDTLSATSAGTCIVTATKAGVTPYTPTVSAPTTVTFDAPTPPTPPVTTSPSASPTCNRTLPTGTVVGIAATSDDRGYWIANNQGLVVACGDAPALGGLVSAPNHPIVGIAATSDEGGYYLVGSDGGVFTFGDATFYGSTGALRLNRPMVGMAVDPATGGYWLVATDGGVFSFNAPFFGSTGAIRLNQPIVGMAPSNGGHGYWLVASDGGIFSFNAPFLGSMGATRLNKPIVGMSVDATTDGYWLVATDGGIFSFNAPFYGSTGAIVLNRPILAMESDGTGTGYRFVASDGGIFDFGSSGFFGSAA